VGLGAPEDQGAAGIEAVVEQRQQLLRCSSALEVDQQIAAAQQVEAGEGRVGITRFCGAKSDHLADLVRVT
jgi:hypothetical protein